MKVGLIDVDSHNFPNLALMKISAFHKIQGDSVEFVNYFLPYDRIYKSKVFTFTPDDYTYLNTKEIITGGTGYRDFKQLPSEIEKMQPDYDLYKIQDHAIGFLTRGCPNACGWCVVPQKEGCIHPVANIEDIAQDRKKIILLDNNVLASEHGIGEIEKIIKLGLKIDFNQGLDARLIAGDPSLARLLSKVKWLNYLRIACDSRNMIPHVEKAIEHLENSGFNPRKIFCYVLIQDDITDALERIIFLDKKRVIPFAQPYRDFRNEIRVPQWQKDLAQWVNKKEYFHSCSFPDFQPRKDFYCREYFTPGQLEKVKTENNPIKKQQKESSHKLLF